MRTPPSETTTRSAPGALADAARGSARRPRSRRRARRPARGFARVPRATRSESRALPLDLIARRARCRGSARSRTDRPRPRSRRASWPCPPPRPAAPAAARAPSIARASHRRATAASSLARAGAETRWRSCKRTAPISRLSAIERAAASRRTISVLPPPMSTTVTLARRPASGPRARRRNSARLRARRDHFDGSAEHRARRAPRSVAAFAASRSALVPTAAMRAALRTRLVARSPRAPRAYARSRPRRAAPLAIHAASRAA